MGYSLLIPMLSYPSEYGIAPLCISLRLRRGRSTMDPQMTDDRNSCTKTATAVGARERLTISRWTSKYFLALSSLINVLAYELLFIFGDTIFGLTRFLQTALSCAILRLSHACRPPFIFIQMCYGGVFILMWEFLLCPHCTK